MSSNPPYKITFYTVDCTVNYILEFEIRSDMKSRTDSLLDIVMSSWLELKSAQSIDECCVHDDLVRMRNKVKQISASQQCHFNPSPSLASLKV
jgi:hypothetical protein